MFHYDPTSAVRPEPDALLQQIAEYVLSEDKITSDEAIDTARLCLMDTLGCGLLALNYPACVKMLGPVVPGATMQGGARVPGTSYELDPVRAAFNIGAMVRWLDLTTPGLPRSGATRRTTSAVSLHFPTTCLGRESATVSGRSRCVICCSA